MENLDLLEKKSSLLKDISGAMVATDNVTVIDNLMLDLAVSYANAEKGSFMLLNERGELYISAARGIDLQLAENCRVKIGDGIAGTVARNNVSTLVTDVEEDAAFKRENRNRYRTKSFISCPVSFKNTLLGVLNVNDKKDGSPFTENDLNLLTILANIAAVAIENALLMTQLSAKTAELEEMNRKLIDTDIMKTDFFARVSHELRTPLNSIKGAVYYLEQSGKSPVSHNKEFYHIISHETSKLIDIVENLLSYARLEDETHPVKRSVISLSDLLKDIAGLPLLRTKLARKNIELTVVVTETLSPIVGDRIKVAQFFVNLIEGLSLYLDRGDVLEISAHEGDFVTLDFILSRSLPESIISEFLSSGRIVQTCPKGQGLNLFLARRIAELHGWILCAKNSNDSCTISVDISKSADQKREAVIGLAAELSLEFIAELLDLNICSIMLTDPSTDELTIRCAKGLEDEVIKKTKLRHGHDIAGWVASEGKPLLVEDIERDPRFRKKSIAQYNTKSLLALPLKVKDKVIGVLNLNNKKTAESFTTRDLQIASALSERISYLIADLYTGKGGEGNLKRFITSFEALLNAAKMYHKKSRPFQDLILKVMDTLGADEEIKRMALYISLVYDLGLIAINGGILKKDALTPFEIRMIKVHPYASVGLLSSFEFSGEVKMAILHHHERFDGTGYPGNLKHDEIPLLSRVLFVVDAFCAMLTERPYRKAFTKEKALAEIEKGSASLYDPNVVNALRKALS